MDALSEGVAYELLQRGSVRKIRLQRTVLKTRWCAATPNRRSQADGGAHDVSARGEPHCQGSLASMVRLGRRLRVECEHHGYRDIVTRYDREAGLLTYYWRCESCGAILQEANRLRYRPQFAPRAAR